MTNFVLTALALLSVALRAVPAAAGADGGLSWTIYHSWNQEQEFSRRGQLVWGPTDDSDEFEFQLINDEATTMQPDDVRAMLEYGWYHVKIEQSDSDSKSIFQTVPACNLRRANFKDQFEVTFPRSSVGNTNPLTSFSYTPLVSPLAPKTCDEYEADDSSKSFSSRVSVQMDTPAMTIKPILHQAKPPPGIKFAKNSQPSGSGATGSTGEPDEDGNPPPQAAPSPFGFFSKYWYIILPLTIMQMITVPEEEGQQEGQQQGQQQQKQGGGQQRAPAASSQKVRRGKRN